MNKLFTSFSKFFTLIILFSLLACYSDDATPTIESSKKGNLMLHKNGSFLEKNIEINSIVNELNNLQKSNKISKSANDSDFIIYKDNVTYIRTPNGERESYTFFIEKEYKRNLNFVENIVLSKKKNSDKYEAVLITYFFPDGYMVDNKNFQVLKTLPLDIDNFTFLNKKSSGGCIYDVIETEHSCYSGKHSGAGQSEDCDHKGYGPYSTYELYLSCDGSSGGGGGGYPGSSEGPETGPPGSGGNNGSGGANNGIDTGITLPPSCQGTQCDEVVLPNQINTLLGKKLNISQLMFLYENENIANYLHSLLKNYNTYSQDSYLWIISYLHNNSSAKDYFNLNKQDLDILFTLGTDNLTNSSAIADTLVPILIKGRNNDLSINDSREEPSSLKEQLRQAFKLGFPYVIELIRTLYIGSNAVVDAIDEIFPGTGTKPNTINYINKFTINPLRNLVSVEYMNYDVHTMLWKDILLAWLFELGTYPINDNANYGQLPTIGFVGNDYVISGVPSGLLRNLSNHKTMNNGQPQPGSVNSVRQEAINRIKGGELTSFNREWVFGSNEVFDTMKELDGLQFVLGSYQTTVHIKNLGNSNYELTFQIKNKTGWESATRGFNNGNGNSHDDSAIPDKNRGNGLNLGGTIAQTYGWKKQ